MTHAWTGSLRVPVLGRSLLVAAIIIIAWAPAAVANTVEVPQGSVGRWPGDACDRCMMHGRAWEAVDGTCYYPVDMDRRAGRYDIARVCDGTMESGHLTVIEKPCVQEDIDFPDERYVTLSSEDLARHNREQATLEAMYRQRETDVMFTLPLAKPAEPLPASDNFGACRTFNGIPKSRHTGADYAISGTAKAVGPGTVVMATEHFFAGNSVYVDHGNGLFSMLFHLGDIQVAEGDTVSAGDPVGAIGSTGRSTGIHLHLGIRWHGEKIDPAVLLASPESMPTVTP